MTNPPGGQNIRPAAFAGITLDERPSSPCWPTEVVAAWPPRMSVGAEHHRTHRRPRPRLRRRTRPAPEQNAEIEALRLLRNAAKKDRYWRAAAWVLERKNPYYFAPQKPNVLTDDQLRQIIASLAAFVLQDLPEEKYEKIMQRLDQLAPLLTVDCPASRVNEDATVAFGPDTPSTARGFATDPTKTVEYFGDAPSPQLTGEQALPRIDADANETARIKRRCKTRCRKMTED